MRPFAEEHLDKTLEWLQDQDLRRDFMLSRTIDRAAHQTWFKGLAHDTSQAVFAIEAEGLGHVGNAGVKNLERDGGELWIYLRPGKIRSRGLGTRAVKELVRILFAEMNLKRIWVHVAEFNRAALRIYEKNGFVRSEQDASGEWAGKGVRVVRMRLERSDGKNQKTVLLACYDAGGANALAVLSQDLVQEGYRVLNLAVGPAGPVYENQGIRPWRKYDKDIPARTAEQVLDQARPDCVVLGTSLQAWTERNICREAGKRGIPRISLVDFWSNYALRFSSPGQNDLAYLPDRVAVLDEFCRSGCLEDGIPGELMTITGNPYWDYLCSLKDPWKRKVRDSVRSGLGLAPDVATILIISSNLKNLEFDFGFRDQDVLETIFKVVEEKGGPVRARCLIKPHPGENKAELEKIVRGRGLVLEPEASALEAVLASDMVVGSVSSLVCETALLGRRVVSFLPALFPGHKRTLRFFSRMNIPEISSPAEMEDRLKSFLVGEGEAPAPLPDTVCSGTALKVLRKTILELSEKKMPGNSGRSPGREKQETDSVALVR